MSNFVMLAYFAQRPDQFLNYLDKEQDEMAEFCERGDLSYLPRKGEKASVGSMVADINRYKDKVVVFHYSGHADSNSIFFNSGAGDATGLANLLGQCPNLKLVFLNGCSTWAQVEALFNNKVKSVIATRYNVRDSEARIFSTAFYQHLFDSKETLLTSFRNAIINVGLRPKLRPLLPKGLQGSIETIKPVIADETYRGGLKTAPPADPPWGIFIPTEGDPILISDDWLPMKTLKVQLERAYTCGRDPISGIFRRHYRKHAESKGILHYFVVDSYKKSPEGVSIKSLFEIITKNYYPGDPMPYHYPCDPNLSYFKEKVVQLEGNDRSADEILDRIYTCIQDHSANNGGVAMQFPELYQLPAIRTKKQVFIFIRMEKEVFERIKKGLKVFIDSSVKYDRENPGVKPQLLFFWHILTEEETSSSGLNFRQKVGRQFKITSNDYISFLHEDNFKPLPILGANDPSKWMVRNDITTLQEANQIFERSKDDINLLEIELRELIQKDRTK